MSIVTWEDIVEGTPVIAIGTLKEYTCLTLDDIMNIYINENQQFLSEYEDDLLALIQQFPGDKSQLIQTIHSSHPESLPIISPFQTFISQQRSQQINKICNNRQALFQTAQERGINLLDYISTEQICSILLENNHRVI